jgi:hypothetical protein
MMLYLMSGGIQERHLSLFGINPPGVTNSI